MVAQLASATLLDGPLRQDLSVPQGTTVAGLLSILKVDTSGGLVRVTRVDGTPVDPSSTIGVDLPSGVLLALSGGRANSEALTRAAGRVVSPWVRPTVATLTLSVLVAVLVITTLLAPLFAWLPLSWPVRGVGAALTLVLSVGALTRQVVRDSAAGVLVGTAALGTIPTVVLPVGWELSGQLVLLCCAWGGLLAAVALWVFHRTATTVTCVGLWALVAVVGTGTALTGASSQAVWAVTLGLCALGLTIVPSLSFRIPDTQLLDLPLVTTSAPTVRAPKVSAPAKITPARIRRSLDEAHGRANLLVIALCVLALAAAVDAAALVDPTTWQGRCALALYLSSAAALALVPRSLRSPLGRIAPRATAVAIVVVALTCHGMTSTLGTGVVAAILVLSGTAFALANALAGPDGPTALVRRLGDIVQSFSLLLALPCAIYASGAFTRVWQVAS
ncbi:hypothetical protein I6B53_01485 [Schaalia sp. 19OD2882]|uniref:hypothetical protein n=1 Tax=Schaalia sp. 19OD2882 TaxID=2794089 RepID=UPI001C1F05D2|nr:hypothetical protein [Schaalia sp. 19OD2882]QWW19831.1 hypothetical protein I6B53_01485 [Schaalia sp. 19OD2882]